MKAQIIKRREEYFSIYKKAAQVVVMNYDTALMAFSDEEGGGFVCYDLTGKDEICGMKLLISAKLKNHEIIVGGPELAIQYSN